MSGAASSYVGWNWSYVARTQCLPCGGRKQSVSGHSRGTNLVHLQNPITDLMIATVC